ncbi:hypothetical protein ABPG72_009474, partial [Tetrahymena utriculariae]
MAFLLTFHEFATHHARFPFVFQISCSEWDLLFNPHQIRFFPPTRETIGNIRIYIEFFEIKGIVRDSNPLQHCKDPPTRPLEPLCPSEAIMKQNLSEKEQEISSLKVQVYSKNQEVENLQNNLRNLQNQNLPLQQKQDSLQINIQTKDQFISQFENELSLQKNQNEILKQNLENQKNCFLENQDRAQKEIQELKKQIKENQDKAQQKIQQLEQRINQNYQGIQQVNNNNQIPQQQM